MKITEVTEARFWFNKATGATASLYGSTPWSGDAREKSEWEIRVGGWTWRLDNGTVGCGRRPAATRDEAEAFMREFNSRGAR